MPGISLLYVPVNVLQPRDTDGARVREDVRQVTAYRPSPHRVKRARAWVRRSRAEGKGSGLGLERVGTCPEKHSGT